MSRRYAGLGPSRVRTRIPSTRRLGQYIYISMCRFANFYACVCDNNFFSLVASRFSWRYPSASTWSFLDAAMNLRPPFVIVSAHTSAFNAAPFQSLVMPNARMSPHKQSVHSYLLSTPSSPHCTLKVSEHEPLWQPPAAHSDERLRQQQSSRAQRCINALAPGCPKGTVVRGLPMVWSLALCPDDAKQDSVVYGAEFGVVLLAEGPRTASIQRASVASAFTIRFLG